MLLCAFVAHTRGDLEPHVPQLLRGLVLLLADDDRDVLLMAWEALSALTKTLDAERQIQHVSDVRQAVRYAAADLKGDLLPGFCLPKVMWDISGRLWRCYRQLRAIYTSLTVL